jgi:hypothetical protein
MMSQSLRVMMQHWVKFSHPFSKYPPTVAMASAAADITNLVRLGAAH